MTETKGTIIDAKLLNEGFVIEVLPENLTKKDFIVLKEGSFLGAFIWSIYQDGGIPSAMEDLVQRGQIDLKKIGLPKIAKEARNFLVRKTIKIVIE